MVKKIFASVILFICLLSNVVFAYKWVQFDGYWYVLNETTNTFLTSLLFDTRDGVFYLKEDGKMVTGWWQDPKSQAYYFFDNRNLASNGSMIFGLHMIDGFYFYFNQDGKLATSTKLYELEKVVDDYYADYDGYLYSNNSMLRDISLQKSEFYSNPKYYNDPNMTNLTLSTIISPIKTSAGSLANSQVLNSANIKIEANTNNPYNSVSNVSGGTNYYVDENGVVRNDEKPKPLSNLEVLGPASGEYNP